MDHFLHKSSNQILITSRKAVWSEGNVVYTTDSQILWGLGLSEEQTQNLRSLAGPDYVLRTWPADALPDFHAIGGADSPHLICLSIAGCRAFAARPASQTGHLELVPKMLLLEENAGPDDLEKALDFGEADIIRPPLTPKRLAACLRRAAEAAALHRDIQNMTREIFLDRELLERKNNTLRFLVNFLTSTAESFAENEILTKAYVCLQHLFPVLGMHAALFEESDDGEILADLYVAAPKNHAAQRSWRDLLLECADSACSGKTVHPTTTQLLLPGASRNTARPGDGHLLTLPLIVGKETLGVVLLLTSMERNLGRDETMALDSALRHLALSLKNARRFQQACRDADCDSLTGIYNRRHFEQTLHVEIQRHRRYRQDMSLLMLDIDYFKKINDTLGHQAGDSVLRNVSGLISETIRQADYCARYGGEEFVILLPHTDSDNAQLLADRLRRAIEKHAFAHDGKRFTVTASLGVASLAPGGEKSAADLAHEADLALYQAKRSGRNQVIVSPTAKTAACAAM